MSWHNDARFTTQREKPVVEVERDGEIVEVELPWRWEVCDVCDGRGTHVNPNIDAGGLSAEDFAEDPDFAEDYFSGVYDVKCNACGGRTTVPAVDFERCEADVVLAYEEQQRSLAQSRAEQAAERRMGA